MACSKSETTCDTTGLTYTADVKSILSGCGASGCHESGSVNGGLTTYNEVKTFISLSKMVASLKHEAGVSEMPQGQSKLDDCSISKVEAWIKAGLPQ